MKNLGGRPSIYKEALALKIAERISRGCTLREICSRRGYPCESTVRAWLKAKPEFAEQMEAARLEGFEAFGRRWLSLEEDTPANNRYWERVRARELRGRSGWGVLRQWHPARHRQILAANPREPAC